MRLNNQKLEQGSLHEYQTTLAENFWDDYQAMLIIIRSNFGKYFAFFVPHKFQKTPGLKGTGK